MEIKRARDSALTRYSAKPLLMNMHFPPHPLIATISIIVIIIMIIIISIIGTSRPWWYI